MSVCGWCGADSDCDCVTRLACPKAGLIGHMNCGQKLGCDCPRWRWECEHIKENIAVWNPPRREHERESDPR